MSASVAGPEPLIDGEALRLWNDQSQCSALVILSSTPWYAGREGREVERESERKGGKVGARARAKAEREGERERERGKARARESWRESIGINVEVLSSFDLSNHHQQ